MLQLGYALSCEEHPPRDLVRWAQRAEGAGFSFVVASDHFHPWVSRQGQSPFVWTVLGAVGQATRLRLGTGVTCPLIRMHPAIVAQAAATTAACFPGRFFLGVGSGENLNEHVTGARWPEPPVRLEMLEEAIGVIRRLWEGGKVRHRGRYYVVDDAKLFTVPDLPPPILVAAGGKRSLRLAGRAGDGLIGLEPSADVVRTFEEAGGAGKMKLGQLTVCWAATEAQGRRTAHEWWPNAALGGDLAWEVKTPWLFEAAAATVREDDVAERVVCGPDAHRHRDAIRQFARAGYTHVWVHQVGADQEGFFAFYEREVLPQLA